MSAYQDTTDAAHKALSPSRQQAQAKTSGAISAREALYLRHLADSFGDTYAALTAAGYAPQDANSAKAMAHQIHERINNECDPRSILTASGMGIIEWTGRLKWLAYKGDDKHVVSALKLWGLPLGIFGVQVGGHGAVINITTLQANTSTGQPAGLVRVEVDARRALPAEGSGQPQS